MKQDKLNKLKENILKILRDGEARTCTYFCVELHTNYYNVVEAMLSLVNDKKVIRIGCIKDRDYFKFVK